MSVAIVDYGSGNLHSAAKAFERAARESGQSQPIVVTGDPDVVAQADRIVLPGVGAFADCRRGLDSRRHLDPYRGAVNAPEAQQIVGDGAFRCQTPDEAGPGGGIGEVGRGEWNDVLFCSLAGYGLARDQFELSLDGGGFERGGMATARASYRVELADLPLLDRAAVTVSSTHQERIERYRSRETTGP